MSSSFTFSLLMLLSSRSWAAWPTGSDWTAITQAGAPLADGVNDQGFLVEGRYDLVGDTADPVLFWAMDADTFYFRQRVNLDPCATGSGCGQLYDGDYLDAWGILFSTDGKTVAGVLAVYEGQELALHAGSGTDDWRDFWGDVVWSEDDAIDADQVRVNAASSSLDGSADYLIDIQVPLSVLSALLGDDYGNHLYIAAATARATFAGDIRYFNGDLAGGTSLSAALSDVMALDADEDGLLSGQEEALGTDPEDADSDDDGLSDGDEVNTFLTDPLDCDTDDDTLSDGLEGSVAAPLEDTDLGEGCFVADDDPATRTDPLQEDTDQGGLADNIEDGDGDGRQDLWETDPNDATDDIDGDGDSIPDSLEASCALSAGDGTDNDGDGVADRVEGQRDSDGDAAPDFCDADDDGDTIPTLEEGDESVDTDQDDQPDYLDLDADNDTRTDEVEGTDDDDCDGIRNFQDANDTDGPCGSGGGDDTGGLGDDTGSGGLFGFSGGSFTGGACSALPTGAAWLPTLLAFLGLRRRRPSSPPPARRARAGWLALLVPGSAGAQEINAQLFQPVLDGRILTTVDDTRVGADGVGGGVAFNYADDPFIYRYDDADREEVRILGRVATTDVLAFYNLHPVRLGVGLPLHLAPEGYGVSSAGGTLLGDVRLDLKAEALNRQDKPLGLGGSLKVTLPTGNGDAWLGAATPTFTGQINASTGPDQVVVAGNLGFQFAAEDVNQIVGDVTAGSRLVWGLGSAVQVREPVWLSAELTGHRLLASSSAAGATPLEGLLTARLSPPSLSALVVAAGGGMGLSQGLGAPDFRAVASVTWAPPLATAVPMPVVIEELPASSGTTAPNVSAPFPYVIAVTDPDGRPLEAWVQIPERDFSARLGQDGALRGTLPAGAYEVVLSADGYARTHRVLKSDGGGGTVSLEVVLLPTRVTVGSQKLEVSERIFFELDSDVIKTESYSLLDEIGQVMADHPEILLIEVQGHTDDQGAEEYNRALSQRRAEAVRRYLVEIAHISGDRLVARGFGESAPLQPGTSETARAINRRVEFVILRTSR